MTRFGRVAVMSAIGICVATIGTANVSTVAGAPSRPTQPTQPPQPSTTGPAAPTSVAAPVPTTGPVAATSVPGSSTTTSTVAGPPPGGLPADASLEQIQQAIQPMFGPSTDLMAEFTAFGITPPAGVPTPEGADINMFNLHLIGLDVPEDTSYVARLGLTSTMPAAELVTLYQTQLPAAGFTQTGDSVENTAEGTQIRWLEYDPPATTSIYADFAVGIVDDEVDYVQFEFGDSANAAVGAAYSYWSGIPLVDQAVAIGDVSIGNYLLSGNQVAIDTEYVIPIAPADLEAQFLASLAGTPYTHDAASSMPGSWATLTGGGLSQLQADFYESHTHEGMSRLVLHGYYERQA